ncbi:MAG: hypothetical protein ABW067_21025 [Rhizobacter sp.]
MLLVVGEGLPSAVKPLMAGSKEVLAKHLHTFALAGLRAVGEAYRQGRAAG